MVEEVSLSLHDQDLRRRIYSDSFSWRGLTTKVMGLFPVLNDLEEEHVGEVLVLNDREEVNVGHHREEVNVGHLFPVELMGRVLVLEVRL